MSAARILIVDDHDVVREGVRALVESHSEWTVCGEASTGRGAVDKAVELKPDVIVLDIMMPNLNGLEAIRQIKKQLPAVEIVALSGHRADENARPIFEAGARSFLFKTEAREHLLPAITALLEHKPYFTPKVSEILFRRFEEGKSGAGQNEEAALTPRERETVQLLAEGKTNKEVAAVLGISVKTVETHRAAIMAKLGLDNFSGLVRYAIRNKIIEP